MIHVFNFTKFSRFRFFLEFSRVFFSIYIAAAADVRPPPAHSNKVKTEPYLRDISPSSYEQHGGRPLTTPPHGMPGGTSPSPGPPRPPSSSSSRGGGGSIMPTPTTQAYMGRNPLPQPSISRSQPALSPKISSSGKPPLTIQTGSITQGTPVQQGAQQRYAEMKPTIQKEIFSFTKKKIFLEIFFFFITISRKIL